MNNIICSNCKKEIDADSDFCPTCGFILINDVKRTNHTSTGADYVCVICREPFCKKCGAIVSGVFLCTQHDSYEVYEGMA